MTPSMERDKAARDLARRTHVALACALLVADMTLADVDRRVGWRRGVARGILLALANGEDVSLRQLAEFAWACGQRLQMRLEPKVKPDEPA